MHSLLLLLRNNFVGFKFVNFYVTPAVSTDTKVALRQRHLPTLSRTCAVRLSWILSPERRVLPVISSRLVSASHIQSGEFYRNVKIQ